MSENDENKESVQKYDDGHEHSDGDTGKTRSNGQLTPDEAAKLQEAEEQVDLEIPQTEEGAKKNSKGLQAVFAVVAIGLFALYLVNQGLGGKGQQSAEQQTGMPPRQGAGNALIGKGEEVKDDPLAVPTNPAMIQLAASDAVAREASAVASLEQGNPVVSMNRSTGAEGWDPTKQLPPAPPETVSAPQTAAPSRPETSAKQEERVNPKMDAVNQFLSVYMSYPSPGLAVSQTRAQELEALAAQEQAAVEAGASRNEDGSQGNGNAQQVQGQQQGNVVADAGDIAYGEMPLTTDSRMPGSPVKVVLRGGKLNGAVLMGTNTPIGSNGQIFKMTSMTLRGRGTYPISAVLINPADYDMANIADKRRNPTFLRTIATIGVQWAARFGQAKINNNSTTTITSNAVVTTNGRQRNKDLAVGALGEAVGDAEDAATGYINEKLAPYSKVLPGKEVGVLFLSSVVL